MIHIEQWPSPIKASKKTLLDAALDAGVPFPHSCMSGECGQCKCQLLRGEVRRLSASPDALTPADVAAGRILACRSVAQGEVALRWLAPGQPANTVQKLQARVSTIEAAAHDVMIVRVCPAQRLSFLPGQFARLRLGTLAPRSYSMANQPGEDELEFHIRVVPNGQVSGYVAHTLRVGDDIGIEGPFGDAHWQGASDTALLLLAGGTGLAPMISVLDAALREGHPPEQIHVYHGVREERDLYAGAKLQGLAKHHGFRFQPVFSAGAHPQHLHDVVRRDFRCLKQSQIYVAGPPPMVEAVKALAGALGADPAQIYADAFYATPQTKKRWWQRWVRP